MSLFPSVVRLSMGSIGLLVLLAGCDYTYADVEPELPGVVNGIDLDPLFAPATANEILAVKADWATRDVSVQDYRLEMTDQATLGGRDFEVEIVSHVVAGQRHYGAIMTPASATGSMPVLLYLHGGDGGVSADGEVGFVMQFFADLRDDFVVVVPSFRDEPLRYGGQVWQSEGPASPWNYDVDDAIALLNVAIETNDRADEDRVAAFGMSRGGAVAMLMAARDARVDRVVEFFGPTDFFGPFVQDVAIETLQGAPSQLPGVVFMNDNYLVPLAQGELQAVDLRPQLVMRSAVLYVDDLPAVQMHHGDADTVVPVSQADHLLEAMEAAGKSAPEFEGFIYEGGEHNPVTLPGAFDRAIEFLRPLTR
ncbi:MAG: prolyl oligopeptidase family serine peptidase [Rhodothermales bacterium]|nr:prolyl oligopeptidase family serine peptidase [Rhodothermales bacterium]